jgi:hypothetical protein
MVGKELRGKVIAPIRGNKKKTSPQASIYNYLQILFVFFSM